jgi:hypothetical protein
MRRTKRRTAYLCIPECLFRTYCIDIRAVRRTGGAHLTEEDMCVCRASV